MEESQLKASLEQLLETDKRKDEFLAMLGHELRNPLLPVSYGIKMLLSGVDEEKQSRIIHIMSRQVEHLERLVDDLLEVSRIKEGKVELRCSKIDLNEIVSETVGAKASLIETSRHQLSLNLLAEPVFINGDSTRISQVINNLLDNAVKFTEPGGQILLSLFQDGSHAIVSVRDSGVGIPEHMLGHVFDLFTQFRPSPCCSQAGLGLGLALVRSLVSMHGGTVEARSAGDGCGSEFVVRLPLVD